MGWATATTTAGRTIERMQADHADLFRADTTGIIDLVCIWWFVFPAGWGSAPGVLASVSSAASFFPWC
jgi:hypothetical protein